MKPKFRKETVFMTRVVNTNSPGKRRSQNMRSCAELLRHLSQQDTFNGESKDMLAAIYFALEQIEISLDEAVEAWEKRDYWVKAEQFRHKWTWVGLNMDTLKDVLLREAWAEVPEFMMAMFPNFSDIKVIKFTRKSDLWDGAYERFLAKHA